MVIKFEIKDWDKTARLPFNTSKVMIRGWVTKKTERTTSSGAVYYQLNIAVNSGKNDNAKTDWYTVRIFDETIANQIEQKDLLTIKGYLNQVRIGEMLFVNVVPLEITKHILHSAKKEEPVDDEFDLLEDWWWIIMKIKFYQTGEWNIQKQMKNKQLDITVSNFQLPLIDIILEPVRNFKQKITVKEGENQFVLKIQKGMKSNISLDYYKTKIVGFEIVFESKDVYGILSQNQNYNVLFARSTALLLITIQDNTTYDQLTMFVYY